MHVLLQVAPEGGSLASGEVATVSVSFCPEEVNDCSR